MKRHQFLLRIIFDERLRLTRGLKKRMTFIKNCFNYFFIYIIQKEAMTFTNFFIAACLTSDQRFLKKICKTSKL